MKAIAIGGSSRENGNTEYLLNVCLETLAAAGAETELIALRGKSIEGCRACNRCYKEKNKQCSIGDDFDPIFEKMLEADIIIVGSPVYFGSATPALMSVLDRAGYVSRANDNPLSRKLGGPVVVARRAGQNFTYAQLLYWYMISDMVVPGSTYWNIGFGLKPGDVASDQEAIDTVKRFAENLAWLGGLVASG